MVAATVIQGGSGYVSVPGVPITGGGGSGAQATATVVNGVVTAITATNACFGYGPILHRIIRAAPQKQSEKDRMKDSSIQVEWGLSCAMRACHKAAGHAGSNPAKKPVPQSR